MNKNVAFLGAGSMAEALISGIVHSGIMPSHQILVTNRSNTGRLNYLEKKYGITAIEDKGELVTEADILILAAKPHDIQDSILEIQQFLRPDQLLISVAAGVETD